MFYIAGSGDVLAQRFNFTHYDIESGLIQSQVRALAQSPSRHLWIATQGGVSRFDGSQFTPFTRTENGLASMSVSSLLASENGRIYFGTQNELSVYDGKRIQNFKLPDTEGKMSYVHSLVQDKKGRVFGLINEQMFIFSGNKVSIIRSPLPEQPVTALSVDQKGNVHAAVYGKGIYVFAGNNWKLAISFPETAKPFMARQLLFDRILNKKLWVLSPDKIYYSEGGKLIEFKTSIPDLGPKYLHSIAQDGKSNLWIGAAAGAYFIEPKGTTFFNSRNGFTDNAVNDIFRDEENNIWFATEGAGVYKYDGDKTMLLDKGQGLSNEVVMSFARDRQDNVWIQSFGRDIVKLKNGKIIKILLPVPDSISYSVSQLFNDREGNIWIGTFGAGLWKYDGKLFSNFSDKTDGIPKVIRHIIQDKAGTIWLATPNGCYTLIKGKFSHISNFKFYAAKLLEIGTDSILVSSMNGNYIISGKQRQIGVVPKDEILKAELYSMIKVDRKVFFGTGEAGIWIWDLKSNTFKNLTTKNGLYSNTIYGLLADERGFMWVGTGRGINKIKLDAQKEDFEISGAEYSKRLIVECNQNAMLLKDGKVWVGTTKGAIVFDLSTGSAKASRPHIVMQSVKYFSADKGPQTLSFNPSNGYLLPTDLNLAYRKNQITFTIKGIYLSNPSAILYQYRLRELNENFSSPTANSSVNYQILSPGKYVFEAKALSKEGVMSGNIISFPFEILPAFYQTLPFRFAVILFLILSGIGLQSYFHKRKNRRLLAIESLKREERLKARQQTAEDFHDDLGNKLTRISVLTDILNTRLNGEHKEEKKLIGQIKENASSLYRGTKDILWALDPKSDNLHEILCHISEFGMEIFQDTAIEFSCIGIDEEFANIKLPMEYSRNISMIFKESLNNILRHADASHVTLQVTDLSNSIEITLMDDGKGFDQNHVHKGLGLNNISLRSIRLNSKLDVTSSEGEGTTVSLSITKA